MQLAADTIRSSLHADWRMLTEEAKDTLISSSMQPRPATPEFLELVADESNNPGRCSCGQVCPEEYQADLDCCARGTELAFTWLKTGDLEVRKRIVFVFRLGMKRISHITFTTFSCDRFD